MKLMKSLKLIYFHLIKSKVLLLIPSFEKIFLTSISSSIKMNTYIFMFTMSLVSYK